MNKSEKKRVKLTAPNPLIIMAVVLVLGTEEVVAVAEVTEEMPQNGETLCLNAEEVAEEVAMSLAPTSLEAVAGPAEIPSFQAATVAVTVAVGAQDAHIYQLTGEFSQQTETVPSLAVLRALTVDLAAVSS